MSVEVKRKNIKQYAKLPILMKEYYLTQAEKAGYAGKRFSKFMAFHLEEYLNNLSRYPLTRNEILRYEKLTKGKIYFNYYCSAESADRLKELADGNLRTVTDENLYFLYALYNYMIKKESI